MTPRVLADEVEPRLVNVAKWDSGGAPDHARVSPEWRSSVRRVLDDPELRICPTGRLQAGIDIYRRAAMSLPIMAALCGTQLFAINNLETPTPPGTGRGKRTEVAPWP